MKVVAEYDTWLVEVKDALASINMPFDDWQRRWSFDFRKEFESRTSANDAAEKANRFWWWHQNRALHQDCQITLNCWLPRNHQGKCQVG